jgi:hypothetical protein
MIIVVLAILAAFAAVILGTIVVLGMGLVMFIKGFINRKKV